MKTLHSSKVTPFRLAADQNCEPIACAQCGVYQLCLPLGLHQADLTLLESIVKRKESYKRGQLLYRAGDPFDFIYAIRSGSVKTYVCTQDGRTQITGFHIAGELVGQKWLGLLGQVLGFLKWIPCGLRLSTVLLAEGPSRP